MVPEACDFGSGCQARRAGPDHGYPLSARGSWFRDDQAVISFAIGNKAFECPDHERSFLYPEDAFTLALALLRADAPANSREQVIVLDNSCSPAKITTGYGFDKSGNIDPDRATVDTAGFPALEASFRLSYRLVCGETGIHLAKI
jgi:hypothetical protein